MTEETKKDQEQTSSGENPEVPNKSPLSEFGDSVGKFASQTMESIKHTIDKALVSRNTVLTIRVNDEANRKLGMLVETGIFKSRSESAAFLIEEGIKHQHALFRKMEEKLEQIGKLKEELKDIVSSELSVPPPDASSEE